MNYKKIFYLSSANSNMRISTPVGKKSTSAPVCSWVPASIEIPDTRMKWLRFPEFQRIKAACQNGKFKSLLKKRYARIFPICRPTPFPATPWSNASPDRFPLLLSADYCILRMPVSSAGRVCSVFVVKSKLMPIMKLF